MITNSLLIVSEAEAQEHPQRGDLKTAHPSLSLSISVHIFLTLPAIVIGNIDHTYISGEDRHYPYQSVTAPPWIPLPYVHHRPQATSPHLPRPLSPSINIYISGYISYISWCDHVIVDFWLL